jgi:divalent metal cation (Fe/Co/Zn/Cd) transporter
VVAVFIFKIGSEMFFSGIHGLIDVSMSPADLEQVRKICLDVFGVEGVKSIRSRRMGQKSQLNIDIELMRSKTVSETHEIVKRLKTAVSDNLDGIDNIFVRTIPINKRVIRLMRK